jgi:hypothetical protein
VGWGRKKKRRSFTRIGLFLIGISFFLVIGKEGAWVCYRKGKAEEVVLRMAKRGGSAGKEWEIVKDDDFFVVERNG